MVHVRYWVSFTCTTCTCAIAGSIYCRLLQVKFTRIRTRTRTRACLYHYYYYYQYYIGVPTGTASGTSMSTKSAAGRVDTTKLTSC